MPICRCPAKPYGTSNGATVDPGSAASSRSGKWRWVAVAAAVPVACSLLRLWRAYCRHLDAQHRQGVSQERIRQCMQLHKAELDLQRLRADLLIALAQANVADSAAIDRIVFTDSIVHRESQRFAGDAETDPHPSAS